MPSELLNSYIGNTPAQSATIQQSQVAMLNSASKNMQNARANIDKTLKTDTFEKKNDKKLLMAGITAGALLLGGGLILLARKGKLGEGCKAFIDKIFKPNDKAAQAAANTVSDATEKAGEAAKKYFQPEIRPEKIIEDTGEILYRAEVLYNPKSVEADVADWVNFRKGLPTLSHLTTGELINPKFNAYEIKPHNYADDTRVFISARDHTRDFANYEVENGVMKRLKSVLQCCTKEPDATMMFELQKNGRCLQTGHFDDGRKYVSFAYANGETYNGSRLGYETVMLVSKGTEFTQSQKDAIRIFKTIDPSIDPKTPVPMYFASATIGDAVPSHSDSELVKRFNKNALLSAISSWAEHSPEFDVDKYMEKAGDTFRTGVKMAKLGNLNQID